MNRVVTSLSIVAAMAAGGVALAQQSKPAQAPPAGYLGEAGPDTYKILPPAPTPGTIRYQADRATPILARARSFGESRLICGVHNMSAVEAGRTNGSIVVAGLHGSAAFRADMDAARKEIAALRKSAKAPDGAACAAEAELIGKSPYN